MSETILPDRDKNYDGVPYVGCPATVGVGSDCYPGTITEIGKGRTKAALDNLTLPTRIKFTRCNFRGTKDNSFTENQEYQYYDDGVPQHGEWFSYRKKYMCYVRVGAKSGTRCHPGHRRAYFDPHF